MALTKSLAVLTLMCLAAAIAVQAQDKNHWGVWGKPPKWPKVPKTRLLILKSIGQVDGSESGDDATAKVGDTGTFT
jgi:hypothetical protein